MSDLNHDDKQAESVWAGEADSIASTGNANVELIGRVYDEVWNQGNMSAVNELVSPSYVNHDWPPGTLGGRDGYKEVVKTFRDAFPDLVMTLDQTMAEGDRVAIRVTARGTHEGDFFGFPATNKEVSFGGMVFTRVENEMIAEGWEITDQLALVQQIGGHEG